jgi:hypothetical protein
MKKMFIAWCLLLLSIDCANRVASVTETDTGRITGCVVGLNKHGIHAADVILRSADQLNMVSASRAKRAMTLKIAAQIAMQPESTKSSPAGFFSFDSIALGNYYIEVNDHDSLGAVIEASVTKKSPQQVVDTVVARQLGAIKGSLGNSLINHDSTFIYIVEVDRKVPIDSVGSFLINNLPARDYTIRLLENKTIVYSLLDTIVISVTEQDTTKAYGIGAKFGTIVIGGPIREY